MPSLKMVGSEEVELRDRRLRPLGNYLINEYYQNKKKICFRAFLQRLTEASGRHSKSQTSTIWLYSRTYVWYFFSWNRTSFECQGERSWGGISLEITYNLICSLANNEGFFKRIWVDICLQRIWLSAKKQLGLENCQKLCFLPLIIPIRRRRSLGKNE